MTKKRAREFTRDIKGSKPRGYERDRKRQLKAKEAFKANLAESESAIIENREELALLIEEAFDLIEAEEATRWFFMTSLYEESASFIELEEHYVYEIEDGFIEAALDKFEKHAVHLNAEAKRINEELNALLDDSYVSMSC